MANNNALLHISRGVFADMQAFMAGMRQGGADVIVTATPDDVLTLQNVDLASLDATDPRFVALTVAARASRFRQNTRLAGIVTAKRVRSQRRSCPRPAAQARAARLGTQRFQW